MYAILAKVSFLRSKWFLCAAGLLAALTVYFAFTPKFEGVPETIFSDGVTRTDYALASLTLGIDGYVYGAKANSLHRIIGEGERTEEILTLPDAINGIHFMANSYWVIATDADRWDTTKPCRIYLSKDQGKTVTEIKVLEKPSAIYWSLASDKENNIYVGEYGPKDIGVSERVWKTSDFGKTWRVTFQTKHKRRGHIHRVIVDPYTNHLLVSHGDGKKARGVHMSKDNGLSWQQIHDQKSTGFAFTEDKIYFGEDTRKGLITAYDRNTGKVGVQFVPGKRGNYAGSTYDLAIGSFEQVFAPLVKYPHRDHPASLWVGKDTTWKQLLVFDSQPGQVAGAPTIAGPDKYGYLYVQGYKIEDRDYLAQ